MASRRSLQQIARLTALILLATSCSLPISTPEPTASSAPIAELPGPSATSPPDQSSSPTQTVLAPTPASPTMPAPSGPTIGRLSAGIPLTIGTIRMVDAERGWAMGGNEANTNHVLRTADGGATWHDVTPPQPSPLDGLGRATPLGYFLDERTGWVVYPVDMAEPPVYAVVWRTENGGTSWEASQALRVAGLEEVFEPAFLTFVDGQHGWLLVGVGAGMSHRYVTLYRTEDRGATWVRVLDPSSDGGIQSLGKTGLVFADIQTGWLTRDNFGIVDSAFFDRTRDGGTTWESVDLPPPSSLPDLFQMAQCVTHSPRLTSPTVGSVAVECQQYDSGEATTIAYLYRTTDGGSSWNSAPYPGGEVVFIDDQVLLALSREIQRSHDGGQVWAQVKAVNWDGQFSFVDELLAWAVATNEEGSSLVRSRNGGASWQLIEPVIGPG